MKTIVALFLACFTTALFGQAPPIVRNPWNTNSVPTNGVALTPTFYGKVGFGTNGAITAIELRDGSSDQAILMTRELNTSYTSLGFRTGGTYEWQFGQRNGDSDIWLFNAQNNSYFNFDYGGVMTLYSSATAGVQDNSINVLNKSGGFSAAAFYDPKGAAASPSSAAAVTIGFGPGNLGASVYSGRAYIGLNPSNTIGLPPEFVIAQEQTNSAGTSKTHIRTHFTQTGAINFYNYNDSFQTGTVALAIGPEGNTTFGAAQGTNTTFIPGITALGPNTNVLWLLVGSSATGPGTLQQWATTNGVTNLLISSENLTNRTVTYYGNVDVGFSTLSNNATAGSLDLIPTNGGSFTAFKLHLSGSGNGIGTLSPVNGAALDAPGAVYVGTLNGTNGTFLGPIGATANPILHAGTNSVNGLTVSSNGNVGVGTATPLAKLDVSNAVGSATGPIVHFGTNTANGLTVDTNGNVSIGKAVPTAALDVVGAGTFSSDVTIGPGRYFYSRSTAERIGSPAVGVIEIGTTANVGIGTTTPAYKLHVIGDVLATNGAVGIFTGTTGPAWATNGIGAIWCSNGAVYARASRVAGTNWADTLILAAP